jgi:SAM-dependent methyltransferase
MRFRCEQIESLPFPDASFDVVTATGVLEYSDVARSLGELQRILRPGGRAVVSYPNPQAFYGLWKTRVWYPATRALKRLLHRPNPNMPHGASEMRPARFLDELRRAGLVPVTHSHSSYLALLTPLEQLLPRPTRWIGARLERRDSARTARLFATQIVYHAYKPQTDVQ